MKIAYLVPLVTSIAPLHAARVEVHIGRTRINTAFETDQTASPARNDAATGATFKLVSGNPDPGSASIHVLHDGNIPAGDDDPSASFFLASEGAGGRILVDLGKPVEIADISTYSWHNGSRAAQNYVVYASEGTAGDFNAEPAAGIDPAKAGWTLISEVDTSGERPGQHAVTIVSEDAEPLGKFRYVLFDVKKNPREALYNDTFFSEIDITGMNDPAPVRVEKPVTVIREFASKQGEFHYILDSTSAPDLEPWCADHLVPIMDKWYPKLIAMLPVEGITPAKEVTFTLKNSDEVPAHLRDAPAFASGNSVVFNAGFLRDQKTGEAIGAGIHEMVHVVQFGGVDDNEVRRKQGIPRPPEWIIEGVADYIRWFLYEPESKGAEITRDNFDRARHDSSYRITANFFAYIIAWYDKDLMRKLNVATHDGYSGKLWEEWTGKSLQDLGDEWKAHHGKLLGTGE